MKRILLPSLLTTALSTVAGAAEPQYGELKRTLWAEHLPAGPVQPAARRMAVAAMNHHGRDARATRTALFRHTLTP